MHICGALVMFGKNKGLINLIEKDVIAASNSHLMKEHCTVYQENLCDSFKNG